MNVDTEFVQKLIKGSRRIDQMKKEVDQVVGMILGLSSVVHATGEHKRLSYGKGVKLTAECSKKVSD